MQPRYFMFFGGLWCRLNGNKTFLMSLAMTIYAGWGFATHMLDANTALQIFMTAGLGACIRHAIFTNAHPGFQEHRDCEDDCEKTDSTPPGDNS